MQDIIQIIQKIKSFYPLSGLLEGSVNNFFEVKYDYNSNALEGTTFTEEETARVLKGETIPYHIMREHFEVLNHKKAFDFIKKLSKNSWKEVFNEKNILKIHELILANINDDFAGRYRNMNVKISGSNDILPNYMKIPELMEKFVADFIQDYEKLDLKSTEEILKYGYKLQIDFVKIHPFIDGNGRIARLITNLWFYSNFSFIDVVYMKNRAEYIETIGDGDYKKFYEFMNKNFEEFLNELLEILEGNIYYKS